MSKINRRRNAGKAGFRGRNALPFGQPASASSRRRQSSCGSNESVVARPPRRIRMDLRGGPSADRRPGAILIAAGDAAGGLRLATDIDGVGVGTAIAPIVYIGRPRDDGAIMSAIGIPP